MKRNGVVFFAVVLCTCYFSGSPAFATGTYNGGDGSIGNPFQIETPQQLDELGQNPDDWTAGTYFLLTNDIDLAGYDGITGPAFNRIGYSIEYSFQGVFDGANHTISNLTLDLPDTGDVGLFGNIENAEISNLALVNANVSGHQYIGILAGNCYDSNINNCSASGTVSADGNFAGGLIGVNLLTDVSNCYATSTVSGDYRVGGLIGHSQSGDVSNCHATSTISAYAYAGGLIGVDYESDVTDCYAESMVTAQYQSGGLIGNNESGNVSNCYAISDVAANSDWAGGLIAVNITADVTDCYADSIVTSNYESGGLIGRNKTGDVSNCYAMGTVSAKLNIAGGLIGLDLEGNASNCYATGDVMAVMAAGGLIGYIAYDSESDSDTSNVNNCYATSTVLADALAGGLVGYNENGNISNCYATSTVSADESAGGLIGAYDNGDIINCYAASTVTGNIDIGGFIGNEDAIPSYTACFWDNTLNPQLLDIGNRGDFAGVDAKSTVDMTDASIYFNAGWDFVLVSGIDDDEIWDICGDSYPTLAWQSDGPFCFQTSYLGEGTEASPYLITIPRELALLANTPEDWDAWFLVTQNIDMTIYDGTHENPQMTPIGTQAIPFTGNFNGANNTISNLTINIPPDNVGLFGYTNTAEIYDLSLTGVNMSGDFNVGALVGYGIHTNITNCDATGTVLAYSYAGGLIGYNGGGNVNDCDATGNVSADDYAGGLIGYNSGGNVNNCYAASDVSADYFAGGLIGNNESGNVSICYASGTVLAGSDNAGGLIGYNRYGNVNDCYATSTVSADTRAGGLIGYNFDNHEIAGSEINNVSNCYATGNVSANMVAGGLIGHSNQDYISNSYASGTVSSASDNAGGLIGYSNGDYVNDCYSTSDVSADGDFAGGLIGYNYNSNISKCYAISDVSADEAAGGLIGINREISIGGNVSNCYAMSTVWANNGAGGLIGHYFDGDITKCYAASTVTGNDFLGGFIGYKDSSQIYTACFWDNTLNPTLLDTGNEGDVDGANAASTVDMMDIMTYINAGWDLVTIYGIDDDETWDICNGSNYPTLAWQNDGPFCYQNSYQGDGTEATPYLITNAEELVLLANTPDDWDAWFMVIQNIDMTIYDGTYGNPQINPIGTEAIPFTGNFNGTNKTISNLKINLPTAGNVGLFGYTSTAEIYDLSLMDVDISGATYVGALAGNCQYSNITNCQASGNVAADYENAGGLIGFDYFGDVNNCYATGTVSATDRNAGGLIGTFVAATISKSCAASDVSADEAVGGLIGYNESGNVNDCYATGTVSAQENAGGLIGANGGGIVTNCYAAATVSPADYSGGLIGYGDGSYTACFWDNTLNPTLLDTEEDGDVDGVDAKSTVEMMDPNTYLDADWDFIMVTGIDDDEIWDICDSNYPTLAWQNDGTFCYQGDYQGEGTEYNPYLITNAEELAMLAITPQKWNSWFRVTQNIDMSGYDGIEGRPQMTPIGTQAIPFTGNFNGLNKTISNLTINMPITDNVGLFGYTDTAEIYDLSLVDTNISGDRYVGALAGYCNNSNITNCQASANVSAGYGDAGGLTGANIDGNVNNCYATGTVLANGSAGGGLIGVNLNNNVSNCYAMSNVSAETFAGGLIGNIESGNIYNCYAASTVTGNGLIGGFIGNQEGSPVYTACFWDYTLNPELFDSGDNGDVDGVDATSTVDMMDSGTYLDADWDFVNTLSVFDDQIWDMCDGSSYPILAWQVVDGVFCFPYSFEGIGTESNPFLIANADELASVADNPGDWDAWFLVIADIDMNDYSGLMNVIGTFSVPFSGNFNGGGHLISNFTWVSDAVSYVGLFGYIAPDGEVYDIRMNGVNIYDDNSVNIGGIAGANKGFIHDCTVSGQIFGGASVGGIVGLNYNNGTVSDCFASGEVGCEDYAVGGVVGNNTGIINNCAAQVDVVGGDWAGGFVGYNTFWGVIADSYAIGDVSGLESVGGFAGINFAYYGEGIYNCYAAGFVFGVENIGGFFGDHFYEDDYIDACFWDSDVNPTLDGVGSSEPDPVGLSGLDTVSMYQRSTYESAGWDFTTPVWIIADGSGYPQLPCFDIISASDLSVLAMYWLESGCGITIDCEGADYDGSGTVDLADFAELSRIYLLP